MKLFVIGSHGYLGQELIKTFRTSGGKVVSVSSRPETDELYLDLGWPEDFNYAEVDRGDVVLLSAAISAPDICAREQGRAWAINVVGTSSFIQGVIDRGARVVFFSSDAVYGEREEQFDETAACNPAGEYAQMKFEVEQRFSGNVSFKTIRLSYVFSREDKFSRYLAGCAERNEAADLFHPFSRAIVHRDDVVAGALALAKHWDEVPEQIINFGGPQVLSRIDFAESFRKAHFHNLCFKVTHPSDDFFKNRPRVIAMTSPLFNRLLGRSPSTLFEAARLEFTPSSNTEKFS